MNANMPSILKTILAEKKLEIKASKEKIPLAVIKRKVADNSKCIRGFYQALANKINLDKNAVIAEVKKASPSKGIICNNFQPVTIAKNYENNGAACLSVLTDKKFFQGDKSYVRLIKNTCFLPILRKDFIIDEYQIFESREIGADCVLLIAACLTKQQLADFTCLIQELKMDVLIEIHDMHDLDKISNLSIPMVGINNRDLHTFKVDLSVTITLSKQISQKKLLITESGIHTRDDVALMNAIGVKSFLVGESLITSDNCKEKFTELFT